ncbi:MAG TPA: efflux RND transporter periplasmic adaptor subunit [Gemmatimonadales bacterium]|nr:efflux RND transporter periplasmic adaptor subunit [Gemmatimonadales bacterium]
MKSRLGSWGWIGLALVGGSALPGCTEGNGAEAAAGVPPVLIGPENIALATDTVLMDGPPISGSLGAEREARVRAELGGSVLRVLVEPGQAVGAGQVLAELEPQTAREQAAFAEALVRSLENDLRLQRRNLDRDRRLAAAGALSARAVEDDSLAVSQSEAALAEARARQVVAQRALDRASVRAPFAGVVSDQVASVGDVVQAGSELFTIIDPSSLRLEAQVPAQAIGQLRVGTAVQFAVSGFADDRLTGRVTRIFPAVDPATRQVRILVTVPNARGRLVAGLYAEGRVVTAERRGLTVPKAAVDLRGVRPTVAQVTGGRVTRTEVTLGLEDMIAERVEVTAGLAAGDTLLVGGARGMAAGTPVRMQAAAERVDPPAAN